MPNLDAGDGDGSGDGRQLQAQKVLEVILSGASKEKVKKLEKDGLLKRPRWRDLVTECPHNEQLARRFERLGKGEPDEDSC